MADDESAVSSVENPVSSELHKRKLEDFEAPSPSDSTVQSPSKTAVDLDSPKEDENGGAYESEAKRPRMETGIDVPVGVVSQNGHQEDLQDGEQKNGEIEEVPVVSVYLELEAQESKNETLEAGPVEPAVVLNEEKETGSAESEEQSKDEAEKSAEEPPVEGNVPLAGEKTAFGEGIMSRQMEVPNDKVGVLIGKAGDTIRSLQDNSGAKIQITKDADADPRSTSRPLELIGTLESITRAEKLIKDVIAEADAGGSPSLVARGFNTVQAAGGGEQLELQVPIDKVGLIIGKGGETIRNLQTTSGARIQLIQQNPSEENQSKERIVRVSGNKKQIEIAIDMIKEVMNQTTRSSTFSGTYGQQGSRARGPHGSQWPSRGPSHHHGPFSGYDYSQRGPTYPSQNSHMPPAFGNYQPQQGPRNNFGSTWDQRPPPQLRGSSHQGNFNPDYGHPPQYGQTPAQYYGHGYNDAKYDHHASSQNYGPMGSQPTPYMQGGGAYSGYGPQDQYGKPPMYGMPQQGPPYGQPRPNQPGTIPHQGSITQPYGQNVPPQQSYPYTSSGQMQQNYPTYGSGVSTEGYSQQPAAAQPTSNYPSQGGQPAAGYGQPGTQQVSAYPQPGSSGGYGSYPTAQPSYAEQPAVNTGYGYQGVSADASYATGQGQAAVYVQPSQTQPSYDQSGAY